MRIAANIAARTASTQETLQSLRRSGIFVSSTIGISITDMTGRFVAANQPFCAIIGYGEGELRSRDYKSITHPEDLAKNLRFVRQMRAGRMASLVNEKRYVRKDGGIAWVRNSVSILRDPRGKPANVIALTENITAQKRAEDEARAKSASLERLSARVLQLQEDERRRIGRELHDGMSQMLAALRMNLSIANESGETLSRRVQHALIASTALADQCLREIRTVAYLLHSPEPDESLVPLMTRHVKGFVERSGTRVDLDLPLDLGYLPPEVETAVFRILQESLTNVYRHSGSAGVRICLRRGPSEIVLEVRDNGRGIPVGAFPGVGLASMRERVRQLGGKLDLYSGKTGTTLKARIPVSGKRRA